jgi:hypothetical protein
MRKDAVRAERARECRVAARAWRRAGTIDDGTLSAIDAAYPDDRARARPAFRVLFCAFTALGVLAAFGLTLATGLDSSGRIGFVALTFGVLLAAATEVQLGPFRRDRGGTEEATSFLSALFLVGAGGWFVFEAIPLGGRAGGSSLLVVAALILAAAAWRWGLAIHATGSAVLAFWLLARLPHGRLLWAVTGLVASALLVRAQASGRLAPSHRRGAAWASLVAIAGLYASISIYSLDRGLVEAIGGRGFFLPSLLDFDPRTGAAGVLAELPWTARRVLCACLTAVAPAVLIAAGLRRRRRLLLDAGVVLAAVSIATVRAYVHLAAPWLVLAAAGGGLVSLALVLRRCLDSGPGRERGGFTAEPLFESPSRPRVLEAAATLAILSPTPRGVPTEPEFKGGGGESGGAGASGEF